MNNLNIPVYNITGEKINEVNLPETISKVDISVPVLHEVVKSYLNNQRQGTACTKTKGEVRGGGRKPWAQKGTGRARAGSIRSPLWRKGGIIFGPKPRSYREDLPKKKVRLALKMAIKSKCLDNELIIVKSFALDSPKTRNVYQILKKFGLDENNILLVADKIDNNIKLAARNISNFEIININSINSYIILKANKVIFTEEAFNKIAI